MYMIALVLSICVHEFGHAYVADKLGDPLPRSQGRVTLNPIAHADFWGTIVMPLIMFVSAAKGYPLPLLGWGKPVQTNPRAYTRKVTMRRGHMIVAAAGPAMNLVFAILLSVILLVVRRFYPSEGFANAIEFVISMNLGLMMFNLLPIPPLDGGAVLAGIVPRQYSHLLEPLERYGYIILLGLLVTGLFRVIMVPAQLLTQQWLRALDSLALMGS
jgi:Zn-dependent protease